MIKIGNRIIGKDHPALIIAELSANHDGNIEVAKKTIRAAKRSGADAIKLQTYTADTLTLKSEKPDFRINSGTLWDGELLHDLYEKAHTPWEWHEELFATAAEEGLICFSSPFDKTAVDFLEQFNPPAYKVASFEITDINLIEYIAKTGRPIILSTGIAQKEDIQLALETILKTGNDKIALLKCTSSYPAPINEANMIMISEMAKDFNVVTGLSDHTMGDIVPIVAVCNGAKIIEKHFILDRSIGGPDASFSMTEEEFKSLVENVRKAESAIGIKTYNLTEKQKSGKVFSRSLYVAQNIQEGTTITDKHIRSVRPGFSLHPKHLKDILGKKAKRDMELGDRITLEDFTE